MYMCLLLSEETTEGIVESIIEGILDKVSEGIV